MRIQEIESKKYYGLSNEQLESALIDTHGHYEPVADEDLIEHLTLTQDEVDSLVADAE